MIYAADIGWIYRDEYCGQTRTGSGLCRRSNCGQWKIWIFGSAVGWIYRWISDSSFKKSFFKTSRMYPLFGILFIGLIMTFVVEPPIGALNTALNTGLTNMGGASKVVLGMIVAGMMSVDMGGPFNKAAYVFGTASIAAGNYDIMAAVMIGGMVPPCAIALSTLLFKNKFTKAERESGPTNFIMGLAFITEGAIPFAASDPLRVLPSCILGSAAAGALSMAFNCTLMAPHGGIFVFPVVDHAVMYFLALIVGTVLGAVALGLLKKKVEQ